jgi:hypothetical protein
MSMKHFLAGLMMAVGLFFAAPTYAQEAPTCTSIEQFQADVAKSNPDLKLVILSGTPLEAFAANMDRLSGGGHGPMDGLVFIDPETNPNDITVIAVFRDGCYIGQAPVPTAMVKQALGQGV